MDSGFSILFTFCLHEDTDLFIYVQYDYLAFHEMVGKGKIALKANVLTKCIAKKLTKMLYF